MPETRIDISKGKGAPQDALTVETVRDTKRRVTKRQLDQMKRVSAVQRNCAYPGSQTLIDMLPYIDDVGITVTDVRLCDAVLGGPIETFKGKSTLPPQLPSDPPVAPRVAQVQQVLIIDIMVLLGMTFLLRLLEA